MHEAKLLLHKVKKTKFSLLFYSDNLLFCLDFIDTIQGILEAAALL